MLIFLIVFFAILPYVVYILKLRKGEKEFEERRESLLYEKDEIGKRFFEVENKFNELENKLLLYERIYEISKRMQKMTSIKEIVDSFLEMVILEADFKRMAFFDSKFGLI
ncbi:MAG: hypothetical protein DRI36_05970, partial [Caldiserica bacterium]